MSTFVRKKYLVNEDGEFLVNQDDKFLVRGYHMLDLPDYANITNAYSTSKLRRPEKYGLAVEHSTKGIEPIKFDADHLTNFNKILEFMDGERSVIARWYNQVLNKDYVLYENADRPEAALIGGVPMVAVERESENLVENSEDASTWTEVTGAQHLLTYQLNGLNIHRLTFDGSTTSSRMAAPLKSEGVGIYSLKCWVKYHHKGDHGLIIKNRTNYNITDDVSESEFIKFQFIELFTEEPLETGIQFRVISTGTGNDNSIIDVHSLQFEKLPYPTLTIPTTGSPVTRLAPQPQLPDFIPSTGYIAGWVDIVNDRGFLFEGEVSLQIFGDYIIGEINNQMLAVEIPFTWDIYTRKNIAFIVEWDATDVRLHLFNDSGDYYIAEAAADYDPITNKQITFGNQTSIYWFSINSKEYE